LGKGIFGEFGSSVVQEFRQMPVVEEEFRSPEVREFGQMFVERSSEFCILGVQANIC